MQSHRVVNIAEINKLLEDETIIARRFIRRVILARQVYNDLLSKQKPMPVAKNHFEAEKLNRQWQQTLYKKYYENIERLIKKEEEAERTITFLDPVSHDELTYPEHLNQFQIDKITLTEALDETHQNAIEKLSKIPDIHALVSDLINNIKDFMRPGLKTETNNGIWDKLKNLKSMTQGTPSKTLQTLVTQIETTYFALETKIYYLAQFEFSLKSKLPQVSIDEKNDHYLRLLNFINTPDNENVLNVVGNRAVNIIDIDNNSNTDPNKNHINNYRQAVAFLSEALDVKNEEPFIITAFNEKDAASYWAQTRLKQAELESNKAKYNQQGNWGIAQKLLQGEDVSYHLMRDDEIKLIFAVISEAQAEEAQAEFAKNKKGSVEDYKIGLYQVNAALPAKKDNISEMERAINAELEKYKRRGSPQKLYTFFFALNNATKVENTGSHWIELDITIDPINKTIKVVFANSSSEGNFPPNLIEKDGAFVRALTKLTAELKKSDPSYKLLPIESDPDTILQNQGTECGYYTLYHIARKAAPKIAGKAAPKSEIALWQPVKNKRYGQNFSSLRKLMQKTVLRKFTISADTDYIQETLKKNPKKLQEVTLSTGRKGYQFTEDFINELIDRPTFWSGYSDFSWKSLFDTKTNFPSAYSGYRSNLSSPFAAGKEPRFDVAKPLSKDEALTDYTFDFTTFLSNPFDLKNIVIIPMEQPYRDGQAKGRVQFANVLLKMQKNNNLPENQPAKRNQLLENMKYARNAMSEEGSVTQNKVPVVNTDCIAIAIELAQKYPGQVAIVNHAHPVDIGGGVSNGAVSQEEDICRKTDLYASLVKYAHENHGYLSNSKKREGHHPPCYHPNSYGLTDTLYSTNSILKNSVFKDIDPPLPINIITSASLQNEPHIKKPNLPYHDNRGNYYSSTAAKAIQAAKIYNQIATAIANGNKAIVIGAFGCGVFRYPSHEIATLYYDILRLPEFYKKLEVHCAIWEKTDPQNIPVFQNIFSKDLVKLNAEDAAKVRAPLAAVMRFERLTKDILPLTNSLPADSKIKIAFDFLKNFLIEVYTTFHSNNDALSALNDLKPLIDEVVNNNDILKIDKITFIVKVIHRLYDLTNGEIKNALNKVINLIKNPTADWVLSQNEINLIENATELKKFMEGIQKDAAFSKIWGDIKTLKASDLKEKAAAAAPTPAPVETKAPSKKVAVPIQDKIASKPTAAGNNEPKNSLQEPLKVKLESEPIKKPVKAPIKLESVKEEEPDKGSFKVDSVEGEELVKKPVKLESVKEEEPIKLQSVKEKEPISEPIKESPPPSSKVLSSPLPKLTGGIQIEDPDLLKSNVSSVKGKATRSISSPGIINTHISSIAFNVEKSVTINPMVDRFLARLGQAALGDLNFENIINYEIAYDKAVKKGTLSKSPQQQSFYLIKLKAALFEWLSQQSEIQSQKSLEKILSFGLAADEYTKEHYASLHPLFKKISGVFKKFIDTTTEALFKDEALLKEKFAQLLSIIIEELNPIESSDILTASIKRATTPPKVTKVDTPSKKKDEFYFKFEAFSPQSDTKQAEAVIKEILVDEVKKPNYMLVQNKKNQWYLYYLGHKNHLVKKDLSKEAYFKETLLPIVTGKKDLNEEDQLAARQVIDNFFQYLTSMEQKASVAIRLAGERTTQELTDENIVTSIIKIPSFYDHYDQVSDQAKHFWTTRIEPLLAAGKKLALIYPSNIGQELDIEASWNDPTIPLVDIFHGSGQAVLFKEIAKLIELNECRDEVHIIPVSTSVRGGDNTKTNNAVTLDNIKESLEHVARHKGAGFTVMGIEDLQERFAIGGGASVGWWNTDTIRIIEEKGGVYRQERNDGTKVPAISQGEYTNRDLEMMSTTPASQWKPHLREAFESVRGFDKLINDIVMRFSLISKSNNHLIKQICFERLNYVRSAENYYINQTEKNKEKAQQKNKQKFWQALVAYCKENQSFWGDQYSPTNLLANAILNYTKNIMLWPTIKTLDELCIAEQKRSFINLLESKASHSRKEKVLAYQALIQQIKDSDPNTTLSEIIAENSLYLAAKLQNGRSIYTVLSHEREWLDKIRNELADQNPRTVLIVEKTQMEDFQSPKQDEIKELFENLVNKRTEYVVKLGRREHRDDFDRLIREVTLLRHTSENQKECYTLIMQRIEEAFDKERRHFRKSLLSGLFSNDEQADSAFNERLNRKDDRRYFYPRMLREILQPYYDAKLRESLAHKEIEGTREYSEAQRDNARKNARWQLSKYLKGETDNTPTKVAALLVNFSMNNGITHEEKMAFFMLVEKELSKSAYQKDAKSNEKIARIKEEIVNAYNLLSEMPPVNNWKDALCGSHYTQRLGTRLSEYNATGHFKEHTSEIGSTIVGSNFKTNNPSVSKEGHVLDASFSSARTSNGDGVIATADAFGGHLGDQNQDKILGITSYSASKHAVRLMSAEGYDDPDALKRSMPLITKMIKQEVEIKHKGTNAETALACGRLYVREDGCRFVGLNIGDTMLIAYDPDSQTFTTLAKAREHIDPKMRKKSPASFPNVHLDELTYIDVELPRNAIIFGLTDGAYQYLPCMKTQQSKLNSDSYYEDTEINFEELKNLLPLSLEEDTENALQVGLFSVTEKNINAKWQELLSQVPSEEAKEAIEQGFELEHTWLSSVKATNKTLADEIKALEQEITQLNNPDDPVLKQKNEEVLQKKQMLEANLKLFDAFNNQLNKYNLQKNIKIGDDFTISMISARKLRELSQENLNKNRLNIPGTLFSKQSKPSDMAEIRQDKKKILKQ